LRNVIARLSLVKKVKNRKSYFFGVCSNVTGYCY